MIKKIVTTCDKWMKDPEIKKHFDEGYEDFVLSELLLAMMAGDNKSVRALAKEAKISARVVQDIRSGKQKDMKIKNFVNVARACGYRVVLEKGKESISLDEK